MIRILEVKYRIWRWKNSGHLYNYRLNHKSIVIINKFILYSLVVSTRLPSSILIRQSSIF